MRIALACFGAALLAPLMAMASPAPCVPAQEAAEMPHKDVCISAHIYNVVQLADGTRFLDVCPPEMPDDQCRFTIVSYWDDHDTVGNLNDYLGKEIHIRGAIETVHGRAWMVLSHARQFHGGKPRFRPNPLLANGFDAAEERPPVDDPGLRSHGGRRGFMNTRNRLDLTTK